MTDTNSDGVQKEEAKNEKNPGMRAPLIRWPRRHAEPADPAAPVPEGKTVESKMESKTEVKTDPLTSVRTETVESRAETRTAPASAAAGDDTNNYFAAAFTDKNFGKAFVASIVSVLIILLIGFGIAWHYRGRIFGYFAKEYLKENTDLSSAPGSAAGQGVFTQDSFVVNAVKKTNPAVVSIIISKDVPKYVIDPNSQNQNQQNPFGDLFPGIPNFFFSTPQYVQNGTQKEEVGGGSGFFVSSNGLIVTNKHVVSTTGGEYTVLTNDGKKHPATVVARDPVLDIALIKIDGTDYPYLSLGDSDQLAVGQSVIAIGNALGEFRNTVSVGVVSGLARNITAGTGTGATENLSQVIQTDAAINPGNSGGPLLDLTGNVVGVNVAVAEGSQSIGFALPIDSVKGAIESVEQTGKIVRPYLGLRYISINEDIKDANNLSVDYGALVKAGTGTNELAVIPGGPADKAGIVENDIILSVDGKKLDSTTDLATLIRQKSVGDVVTLDILHKGAEKTVKVTLEAAKDNS